MVILFSLLTLIIADNKISECTGGNMLHEVSVYMAMQPEAR
jgi:hypothetical protein